MPKPKNPEHLAPASELDALLLEHRISQARAAALLYVSERQIRYWLTAGEAPRWAGELLRFKIMAGQV